MLAAIVAIHECGHFIAARAQGIHVTKFAIGFGPPLLSYQVQASRLLSISFSHGRLKHASYAYLAIVCKCFKGQSLHSARHVADSKARFLGRAAEGC